jgi:two-component system, OmpR family, phosphate regulon sensor histidine kinase PhoR
MSRRPPLSLAITLAVVMIVLLVVLTVGWVLLNVLLALANDRSAGVYWALLSIGTTFIALLVAGVVTYLALSVKAINLNRRQSNFVDSVTHELKSPIASLKLYLQTLDRRQLSEHEKADFRRFMLEEVERLDRLVNHVLEAGRVEAGHVDGEAENVELAPLLSECAEMVCLRYHLAVDTVRLDLQPCLVRGRRADLDMIFRNLIDNAVKYSASPPRVEVVARLDSGFAVTQVRDNGRGIPAKLRRKIFGRFVRLGSELEREKSGTGLGLYIVRNLVRRLRGTIRVCESPADMGAVFEVRLPGTAAAKEAPAQEAGQGEISGYPAESVEQ